VTAKKKTQNNKQQPEPLPLSYSDVVEALHYALGTVHRQEHPQSHKEYSQDYYTSDSVVEVRVTKRALAKGEDPREP